MLLTSHYMADITALCQRVLVIYAGQLIYDGSLERLLERFAPCREVTMELAKDASLAQLQAYGEIKELVRSSCAVSGAAGGADADNHANASQF